MLLIFEEMVNDGVFVVLELLLFDHVFVFCCGVCCVIRLLWRGFLMKWLMIRIFLNNLMIMI